MQEVPGNPVATSQQSFTTKELTFDRAYGHELTADTGTFRQLTASSTIFDQLCVGTVCITESQLAALLSQSPTAATPTSVTSSASNIRDLEPLISVPSPASDIRELAASTTRPDLTNSEQSDNANSTSTPIATVPPNDNEPAVSSDEVADNLPANDISPPAEAASTSRAASF